MSRKYIRFVVTKRDPVSGHPIGFFKAAYDLQRREQLTDEDYSPFSANLDWFDIYLDAPDRFARSKDLHAHGHGYSWFKPEALEAIKKARSLLTIMERYDIDSKMLVSASPGVIVYEDAEQVVAIPFRDR